MFSIDENNKVKLTIGDTASFICTIVDNDNNRRVPQDGDSLKMYIDGTDFEIEAVINNDNYNFIIAGSDTLDLEPGVYMYRVVLNNDYTIIQDCFIDLLTGKEDENEG